MNLSQITAAVNGYIHRNDAQTVNNIPNAIAFAQAEIARQFFPREAYQIVPPAITSGKAPLPSDFGAADAVITAEGDLAYKSPREFAMLLAQGSASGFYTITGSDLLVDPSVTVAYLNYYARPAELVQDSDSSWLSVYYPDILVWTAVAEQHRFVQDWDQADIANSHALDLAGRAGLASKRNETSGGRLNMRSN
jgi:hypothetical protein